MASNLTAFRPVNRHISIVPHFKSSEAESSGVLLPEDFKPQEDEFVVATVLAISQDCSSAFQKMRAYPGEVHKIVVDSSMIKKIEVKEKSHYIILENYVLGILGRINAH